MLCASFKHLLNENSDLLRSARCSSVLCILVQSEKCIFFFLLLIQPMMEHVRIHPELVTGSKDHELDPRRYIHIPSAIKEVYK